MGTPSTNSNLTLGWKVDDNNDPIFWLLPSPEPGAQQARDLFVLEPTHLKHHSLIIAQSGAGKSFLLGRLVEEILLHTSARCFILDPNSDFRNIAHVDTKLWKKIGYDRSTGLGVLPTEASSSEFESRWKPDAEIWQYSASNLGGHFSPIRLRIQDLATPLLFRNISDDVLIKLDQCERLVKSLLDVLLEYAKPSIKTPEDFLQFLVDQRKDSIDRSPERFSEDFIESFSEALIRFDLFDTSAPPLPKSERTRLVRASKAAREDLREKALHLKRMAELADEATLKLVLARLYSLADERLLANVYSKGPEPKQLEVLDLLTIPADLRPAIIDCYMRRLWDGAAADRDLRLLSPDAPEFRVPTFIVVDEAHNLMPRDPDSADKVRIREHFRKIAAEGRKFSLFLILVTQRPDKLDHQVISECENMMVMRLGSESILKENQSVLGLADRQIDKLSECATFKKGRVFITGPWSSLNGVPITSKFYTAARRTLEGGADMDDTYWLRPPIVQKRTKVPKPRR
jgi:DNA helicase HerA-like ATPase